MVTSLKFILFLNRHHCAGVGDLFLPIQIEGLKVKPLSAKGEVIGIDN
jgi:hypothetical protein